MKKFYRLIGLALLGVAHLAIAQPAQNLLFSWNVPTTRADTPQTALPASELAGYNLYYAVDGGAEQKVSISSAATTSKTVTLALPVRPTPYTLTAAITAIDTAGQESARSAPVTKTFPVLPALPSAPGNFTLTINCANGSCTLVVQ